jgi:hypothetical protein
VNGDFRGTGDDIVTFGSEPLSARLVRLVAIAEAAALLVVIAVALHYRAEAGRLGHSSLPAAQRASGVPEMTRIMLRLPTGRPIAGTVLITAAAAPGGDRAQFIVSAVLTGAEPRTVYDLVGNDCSAVAPLPDHVWATGRTDAAGVAHLSGYAWTGAVADQYWLALTPSPLYGSPGLRGRFAQGSAAPYPAGQPSCGPSP